LAFIPRIKYVIEEFPELVDGAISQYTYKLLFESLLSKLTVSDWTELELFDKYAVLEETFDPDALVVSNVQNVGFDEFLLYPKSCIVTEIIPSSTGRVTGHTTFTYEDEIFVTPKAPYVTPVACVGVTQLEPCIARLAGPSCADAVRVTLHNPTATANAASNIALFIAGSLYKNFEAAWSKNGFTCYSAPTVVSNVSSVIHE
jgi:hypothetical protein